MRKLIGLLIIVVSMLAALYVGIYVMFIGGIVQAIEAGKEDPVNSVGLAWGVFRIVAASFVGGVVFYAGIAIGIEVMDSAPYRKRYAKTAKQVEREWQEALKRGGETGRWNQ